MGWKIDVWIFKGKEEWNIYEVYGMDIRDEWDGWVKEGKRDEINKKRDED